MDQNNGQPGFFAKMNQTNGQLSPSHFSDVAMSFGNPNGRPSEIPVPFPNYQSASHIRNSNNYLYFQNPGNYHVNASIAPPVYASEPGVPNGVPTGMGGEILSSLPTGVIGFVPVTPGPFIQGTTTPFALGPAPLGQEATTGTRGSRARKPAESGKPVQPEKASRKRNK